MLFIFIFIYSLQQSQAGWSMDFNGMSIFLVLIIPRGSEII